MVLTSHHIGAHGLLGGDVELVGVDDDEDEPDKTRNTGTA